MRYLFVFCVALLSLSGCLSPGTVTPTRYYSLAPTFAVGTYETHDATLGVRPIVAARPYKQPMVYRDGLYLGNRSEAWSENPADVVTRAITDAIVATNRFGDAGNAAEMARPDYILIGELRQFHENGGASPLIGEIEVRIEVREARDKAVLWSETVYVSAAMEGMGAGALADAMSRALGELATRVADGIAASL
jgi:ABC-type uncharacterized transport system auxiliary subunit